MSNICLSSTPNLRCQTLSTTESIVLLVPPGLEVVFGIGLILYKRGSRNRLHYFLSGEGLVYCALVFGDLIAHLAPGIKDSLSAFKAFDITIGILSTLPILFITTYLFLFSAKDLVPTLPRRAQSVSKYTILLFIPVVLVFNELGSFLSLTYRLFAGDTIAVKFNNDGLHTFFNTMAILFLTVFQASCFCMCFYRLTRALVDQKRIDASNNNSQEAHLLNGIVWTTIGIKLGAIESVIGFAPSIFALSLTRRILRFLGRACLVIGVMKGLDTVEDFSMLDIRQRMRRSRLLPFISDPVDSSFHQIGGYAYEPSYEAPPAVARARSISMDSRLRYSQEKPLSQTARGTTVPWPTKGSPIGSEKLSMSGNPGEKTKKRSFDSISTTRSVQKSGTPSLTVDTHNLSFAGERRVLVRYQHGRAPTLEMKRLSGLLQSIPSPLTSEGTQSLASPTLLASPEDAGAARSALIPLPTGFAEDAPQSYETAFTDSPLVGIGLPDRRRIRPEVRRTLAGTDTAAARRSSAVFPLHQSVGGPLRGSDAQLAGLHALAMQSTSTVATTFAETYGSTLRGTAVSRSASARTANSRSGLIRRSSSVKRKPVPQWDNLDSAIEKLEAVSAVETTFEPEPVSNDGSMSPLEDDLKNLPVSAPSHRTDFSNRNQGRRARSLASRRPQMSFVTQGPRSMSSPSTASATSSRGGFSWMPDTADIAAGGYAELDEAWERMGLKRIKSVGSAPHRRTPIPSQSTFSRGSMAAQWDDDLDIAEIMSSNV